jgi:cytochrome d ubiquinol oxidase subunit II
MIAFDLPNIWALILGVAVFAYVVMDGFDLGIGILFPLIPTGPQRDAAMNSVAPVWDGNETWLVLGGGGLMAAFPLAYAIVMPAVYAPIIAMLLGLVLRGVAFEFRWRDPAHRRFWDVAFTTGSLVGTLAQGIILGALLQGIKVDGRAYAGGWWDWFSPFTLLTGVALVAGYAMLGACWLIMKAEGPLQGQAYRMAAVAGVATVLAIGAVSGATPFLDARYFHNWLSWPNIIFTAAVPFLVLAATYGYFRALLKRKEVSPFLLGLGLFLLSYIGLGISVFPYVVPGAVTIHEAAAPANSQGFMLVGALVLVPIILGYTGYAYWVFRGKVGHEGYH